MMVQRLRINGPWTQFYTPLLTLAPFETGGNLRGVIGKSRHTGRLPEPYRTQYIKTPEIDYTVVSYGTPIAWHYYGGRWAWPSVKYSQITSKHQGRVFTALYQILGHEAGE